MLLSSSFDWNNYDDNLKWLRNHMWRLQSFHPSRSWRLWRSVSSSPWALNEIMCQQSCAPHCSGERFISKLSQVVSRSHFLAVIRTEVPIFLMRVSWYLLFSQRPPMFKSIQDFQWSAQAMGNLVSLTLNLMDFPFQCIHWCPCPLEESSIFNSSCVFIGPTWIIQNNLRNFIAID